MEAGAARSIAGIRRVNALDQVLHWWRDGEQALQAAIVSFPDEGLSAALLLPGWSRKTLIAHLTRNADALVNLLTWAASGVETLMYASPQARDAEIQQTAALPSGQLRSQFGQSQERLAAAIGQMPAEAWPAQVRTAQGREVPASEVPWMRVREVWVHAVDLNGAARFADIPDAVSCALIEDILTLWRRRDHITEFTIVASDIGMQWGDGACAVSAPLKDLLAWMTGRGDGRLRGGEAPREAPRWL